MRVVSASTKTMLSILDTSKRNTFCKLINLLLTSNLKYLLLLCNEWIVEPLRRKVFVEPQSARRSGGSRRRMRKRICRRISRTERARSGEWVGITGRRNDRRRLSCSKRRRISNGWRRKWRRIERRRRVGRCNGFNGGTWPNQLGRGVFFKQLHDFLRNKENHF